MSPNQTKTKEVSTHGFIPDLIMEEESEDGNDMKFNLDLDHLTRQSDAGIVSLSYTPRYTVFLLPHAEINFQGIVSNTGTDTISDLQVDLNIWDSNMF